MAMTIGVCAVCAAISFSVGRYGQTIARAVRSDGRTYTMSRESLPDARLGYPSVTTASPDDDPIDDARWQVVLEQVRPACAIVGSGSGVCINERGDILTNAHVALELGRPIYVQLADGGRMVARCFAINHRFDLALVGVRNDHTFAHVPFAGSPANHNAPVLCVGNPAGQHPDGQPTPYAQFHVSVGRIVWHAPQPLGDQTLGRTQHNAWTYWGHSGAPLFDRSGRIVALHNSWEANGGTRHAVTHQAILQFLRDADVPFTIAP